MSVFSAATMLSPFFVSKTHNIISLERENGINMQAMHTFSFATTLRAQTYRHWHWRLRHSPNIRFYARYVSILRILVVGLEEE